MPQQRFLVERLCLKCILRVRRVEHAEFQTRLLIPLQFELSFDKRSICKRSLSKSLQLSIMSAHVQAKSLLYKFVVSVIKVFHIQEDFRS